MRDSQMAQLKALAQQLPGQDDFRQAIPVVFRILDKWQCNEEEKMALLGVPRSSLYRMRSQPDKAKVGRDLADRLSYILNLHGSLRTIFSRPESVYGWVRKANQHPLFGGRSAMDLLSSGHMEDLIDVYRHVDAARGANW